MIIAVVVEAAVTAAIPKDQRGIDMWATVCIRCGKQRVFLKKWKEKVDNRGTVITSEIYVCPDKECQKIVDAKFAEMRQKRLDSEQRKANLRIKKPAVAV